MKNLLYLFLALALTFNACKKDDEKGDSTPTPTPTAITMTLSDLAGVGSSFAFAIDSLIDSTITIGESGENKIWDFSSLSTDDTETQEFIAPSSDANGADFTDANLALNMSNDDMTIFLKTSSSKVEIVGMAGNLMDPNTRTSMVYDNYMTRMEFPLTYGSNFLDSAFVTNKMPMDTLIDSIKIEIHTTVNSNVDAWGKVTIPSGTYDCIREHREEISNFSYEVYFFGSWIDPASLGFDPEAMGMPTSDTSYSYNYYAKSEKFIVLELQVDENDIIKEARHLQ